MFLKAGPCGCHLLGELLRQPNRDVFVRVFAAYWLGLPAAETVSLEAERLAGPNDLSSKACAVPI
jgi:hypothetical protein